MLLKKFNRGINIGGYLSQFEFAARATDEQGLKEHFDTYIVAENIKQIADWGFDHSGTFEDGNFKMNNTTWCIDTINPDSAGETYNYKKWESYMTESGSEIETDWRNYTGFDTPDAYVANHGYNLSPTTMFSDSPKSDELQVIWTQVATCIKDNSWKAIYAKSDAEYDQIVADMIAQANEYGYAECVEFQQGEAVLRAEAENAAK